MTVSVDIVYERGTTGRIDAIKCFFQKGTRSKVKQDVVKYIKELVEHREKAHKLCDDRIDQLYPWIERSRSGKSGKSGWKAWKKSV